MSSGQDKFTPENKRKENPLGRIIMTFVVLAIALFLACAIFFQFRKLLIPTFILVGAGIILLTVWIKSFYIYRYLLPATIIICIFTLYPIFYTIFIAFTNYGTGHLLVKEDAKSEILNSKWMVYEKEKALYAEFYIPEKYVEGFHEKWKKEQDKFLVKLDKLKSETEKEVLEDTWYYETEPEIIGSVFNKLGNEEIIAFVFDDNVIEVDENGFPLMTGDATKDSPVVYLAKYDLHNKYFKMEETSFDQLASLSKGMVLITDPVRIMPEQEELEDEQELYRISLSDLTKLEKGLKENIPLALYDDSIKDDKKFLNSIGNEFMRKEKLFVEKVDGLYRLTLQEDGRYDYTTKVWENARNGNFVITKDGKAPTFWKEYEITGKNFGYGMLTLSSNMELETFLRSKFENFQLSEENLIPTYKKLSGKKLNEVDQEDVKEVKKEIVSANKNVSRFNKELPDFKKEFLEMKRKSIMRINEQVDREIANKKEEIETLKIEMKELKKKALTYQIFKEMKEANVEIKVLRDAIRRLEKENKGRLVQLKSVEFPKLNKLKLTVDTNSNIDLSQSIEPGYMTTIGFKNFTKIFTTRNITTPFMRVFVWTVLWSFFSVLSAFAAGLALALVMNSGNLKGKYFYRTLFILPYAIPSFVTVLMWGGFLNDDFGIINLALGLNIPWLQDPSGILPKISCVLVNLWLSFPYQMIISLGALQSIDASMYEAADVDGASKVQQFWRITLPLLLATLGPMLVGSFAFAFNNFAGIYLLTGGGPVMDTGVLPGHTDILISYTYKLAFGNNETDYGLASSIAIIVFFIIGTITFLQFKYTGAFKEVDNA